MNQLTFELPNPTAEQQELLEKERSYLVIKSIQDSAITELNKKGYKVEEIEVQPSSSSRWTPSYENSFQPEDGISKEIDGE